MKIFTDIIAAHIRSKLSLSEVYFIKITVLLLKATKNYHTPGKSSHNNYPRLLIDAYDFQRAYGRMSVHAII